MAQYDDYLMGGAALRRILQKLKEVFSGFSLASEQDVRNIVDNYGYDEES